MALLTSEVRRIKFELGFNVLALGAEPYIGISQLFEQVIQPYLTAGSSTTSSTAVTAASTPTPVTLTLASASGVSAGDRVVVDVDARQEAATVMALAGSTITVLLSNAHSGSYPVTVEGGEVFVREILARLRDLAASIADSATSAGLKSVGRGAVEWYGDGSSTVLAALQRTQMHHRDELASALGVPNLWRLRRGGAASALY